jgi:hypothetical protein
MVRRKGAIEGEMRSAHVKSFGGKKVDDVGCSSECISPVRGGAWMLGRGEFGWRC